MPVYRQGDDAARARITPCKPWRGPRRKRDGYPLVYVYLRGPLGTITGSRVEYAHRLVYEAEHGPIPPGYVVTWRCGRRGCVEPLHLVALPRADAVRLQRARQRAEKRNRTRRG